MARKLDRMRAQAIALVLKIAEGHLKPDVLDSLRNKLELFGQKDYAPDDETIDWLIHEAPTACATKPEDLQILDTFAAYYSLTLKVT